MKRPTKHTKVKKRKAAPKTRIVFDVETELFTSDFRAAKDIKARLASAPKMRLACAFDGVRWMYFLPSEAAELSALLAKADEVVTFNGNGFDMLVLMKHHGLKPTVAKKIRHHDLFELISIREDRWVSLNDLAQLNLAEKKHTKGRDIANLDLAGLKEACRSDVWQTFRLWEMWRDGTLKIPEQRVRKRREIEDLFDVGPGHHMPDLCPKCHAVNTLVFIEHDPDEMSEGQLADYDNGMFGTSYCQACEAEFDWGF
jgi:hypothetical protein